MQREISILLIGSDPAVEAILRDAFGDVHLNVTRQKSGKKGLATIPKLNPHMIVSEFEMDDINGRDLFYHFIEDPHTVMCRTIPFVLYSKPAIRKLYSQELFPMGLAGWLSKPFSAHEMREVLENILMVHDSLRMNRELRQEVKRSEYRYRDLLENANDFIFTLDDDGRFVYLNNRFTPLTGYDKEKWFGEKFLNLIDEEDRNMAQKRYEMAHQGRARLFEAKILSTGTEGPILSFNITPIVEKGSIIGSMGIARDVTEQKLMEKEILDLKNFNESIIRSMEAGLLTVDLEGYVTSLNDGGQRILGYHFTDIVGKSLKSVLPPEEVTVLIDNPPPGLLPYSRETELTVKSGRKIAVGFTATDRINDQNEKVGTIVSFRDITQLKQMQSEVIRMDRLASLGVLASGIAHEIKNPLAGIKALAQACEEEFEEDDSRIEYLTRIVRQVNRLDELLKTFFAYARPKKPDRQHHQISIILREVTSLVSKKMKTSKVTYKEQFDRDLPEIMVDSQQMQQVFLNLILNAIEAMPNGGKLNIKANKIEISSGPVKGSSSLHNNGRTYVAVVIEDSGEGIPKEKLETIFDPFYTTKPAGLGLGLSIVYRIIKEHQGEIHVDSRIGQGTTFTITLPEGE